MQNMAGIVETRVLTLEDGVDHSTTLFRLQKGWQLHFALGNSLIGKSVRVFTNHPTKQDASFEFNSANYYELPLEGGQHKYDLINRSAKLRIVRAGSFSFFATTDGSNKREDATTKGHFLVDPELLVGRNRHVLPLDAINLQTYVSKHLGPFSEWERTLSVSHFGAYNMVHLTPIQELGYSHSAYSLRDQLKVSSAYGEVSWAQVGELVDKMDTEWGMLSMTDLVLNHTARDTLWLREHPESAYNLINCPYLRPAYLLDRTVFHVSESIARGECEARGVPNVIQTEEHVRLVGVLLHEAIARVRIHECFLVHIDNAVAAFRDYVDALSAEQVEHSKRRPSKMFDSRDETTHKTELSIIQDPLYRRLRSTVDFNVAVRVLQIDVSETRRNEAYMNTCASRLRSALEQLNTAKYAEVHNHLTEAVRNVLGHMRYHFVDSSGPRFPRVTRHTPITWKYFAFPPDLESLSVERDEALLGHPELACLIAACNGWVMNDDPLRNFAEPGNNIYIRRELIVWGDSVKLRYGQSPADSPFLWDHMRKYAETTARYFHAVRLDNCHSTPLHVAEWLLEHARRVRPDLFVIAELFTNRESLDNIFVNRLGINSLIRECASAADCHEQGRLVHRFGGSPTGGFVQPSTRPLLPATAHAILFDQTHDNPCSLLTRSVYDLLPTAAICSLACCALGSVRGYDELVPHQIDVVKETRRYAVWTATQQCVPDINVVTDSEQARPADSDADQKPSTPTTPHGFPPATHVTSVDATTGILPARRLLNALHAQLAEHGFNEVYVDQMNADLVAITRHNPRTHESYVLVSRTAFSAPATLDTGALPSMTVAGQLDRIVLEASLRRVKLRNVAAANSEDEAAQFAQFASLTAALRAPLDSFEKDGAFINALAGFCVSLKRDLDPDRSDAVRVTRTPDGSCRLEFVNFPPGSIVIIKSSLSPLAKTSFNALCEKLHLRGRSTLVGARHSAMTLSGSNPPDTSNLLVLASRIDDLNAFNRALFRSEQEERQEDSHLGAYEVPNSGALVYCGLQGVSTVLERIRLANDLGHPLCENLRHGDWLMDYTVHRLLRNAATRDIGLWLEAAFSHVRTLPRYLIPRYFHLVLEYAHRTMFVVLGSCKLGDFVRESGEDPFNFTKRLAHGSVLLCSYLQGADLPELSPSLAAPLPRTVESGGARRQATLSLAAGLPHFASGIWRNWGRDTFIALRGLLLLTERFQDARYLILAYGGCLRHGLIPNLLGGGVCARYNARDAIWWWLNAVRLYTSANRLGGADLLRDRVSRLYPADDSPLRPPGFADQSLAETIQEALELHARGVAFRERNAGPAIDREMTDAGFENNVEIDWQTGFVRGGNRHNCGTWMDKMGSSDYAGNRGHPATPRDGSAIELVAISYAVVSWLAKLHDAGLYPYAGVRVPANKIPGQSETQEDVLITYEDWATRIRQNFEKYFWIDTEKDQWSPLVNPGYVHRKGIYKDTLGSSDVYPDYQLRPNQCIAMTIAPELFNVEHARIALKQIESFLLAPLGMRTLDPSDLAYNGDYYNHDDSHNYRTAHGFNYHNGPEWLWLTGYFLRAKLRFFVASRLPTDGDALPDETIRLINQVLSRQQKEIIKNDWCGLPELTNRDGAFCPDSCPAQAWSMACALEVLYDLRQLANTGTL